MLLSCLCKKVTKEHTPDFVAIPHFEVIFFTESKPDVRYALARRYFPKNHLCIWATQTGNIYLSII